MLLASLSLAFALSALFRELRLPRVVAQILAGALLGLPAAKALLFDAEALGSFKLLADIGLILLFFFVGLETNISAFRKNAKESVLISVFNTALPFVAGYGVAHYAFGLETLASLVIGLALAVSSQSISFDFLEELKLLRSKIGQLIVSAGTVDDVFELVLVSGIITLITATASNAAAVSVFLNLAIFIAFLFAARYSFIPIILSFVKKDSRHMLFMSSVIIVLLISSVAELLRIGAPIGALFAGILLRQTLLVSERMVWEEHQIAHALHIVSFGFFVPIFLIWIGLTASLSSLLPNIPITVALILIAVIGTVVGSIIGVKLSKGSFREGYLVGWGVTAKGDTELVIATLALSAGIIPLGIFTALVAMSAFTTLISPVMFKALVKRHYKIKV